MYCNRRLSYTQTVLMPARSRRILREVFVARHDASPTDNQTRSVDVFFNVGRSFYVHSALSSLVRVNRNSDMRAGTCVGRLTVMRR